MNTRRTMEMPWRQCAGIFLMAIFGLIAPFLAAQAGIADHLVINEIQIDGLAGTGGTGDDFIEIYNPTDIEVDLAGWSLQKHAQTSTTTITKIDLAGKVPAKGYYLAVNSAAAATLLSLADFTSASISLADNNTVYLVNDNIKISGYWDENIIDYVGLGSALIFEGSAAAPNPDEAASIARTADGEDTDDNAADFAKKSVPTPQNNSMSPQSENGLEGTVLLTLTLPAEPVQDIGAVSATVVFSINDSGYGAVDYGLTDAYGSTLDAGALAANVEARATINNLSCGSTYHYRVRAWNAGDTENDQTADATFSTLPCGIALDSLVMTRTAAKASNKYEEGWEWKFNLTVWDERETRLKMKFNQWSGSGRTIAAAFNMRFSADSGAAWVDISQDAAYPSAGADIGALDLDAAADGRQIEVIVRMKVPVGTIVGNYASAFGILTEIPAS